MLTIFVAMNVWAKDIYYCPMHPHYTSDKPGDCPICNMKLVKRETVKEVVKEKVKDTQKKILYWTDTMIPGFKSDHPGKSPMGMDMTPVYEQDLPQGDSGVKGYATISIEKQKQQLMGIRTTKVVRKPFVKTIHAVGSVTHDFELYESQLQYIDAWQQFYAFTSRRPLSDEYRQDWREYYKNNMGKRTSADLRKAQQRLIKAEYELRHMGLTSAELDKLREVKYGRPWVSPSLLFFSEDHPYWVYAEVFESDLGFVDVGQKVVVEFPAYGKTMEGTVRAVAESVDPNTRTIRVRIELPKAMIEVKEGMFVNVTMSIELNNSLLVPRDAVMMTGTRAIAFVQSAQGVFSPREIQVGLESDGFIEVIKGLEEGQEIVNGANFLVDSESRLQAALAGFSDESSPDAKGDNHE